MAGALQSEGLLPNNLILDWKIKLRMPLKWDRADYCLQHCQPLPALPLNRPQKPTYYIFQRNILEATADPWRWQETVRPGSNKKEYQNNEQRSADGPLRNARPPVINVNLWQRLPRPYATQIDRYGCPYLLLQSARGESLPSTRTSSSRSSSVGEQSHRRS